MDYIVISDQGFCQVREQKITSQKGVFSNQDYKIGDVLVNFSALKVLEEPDYLTVQVGINKHIYLFPTFLQYVNHSCSPNVLFNTTTMALECVSSIHQGDELRFFYPATEWEMSQPFMCNCGASNCLELISGAAFMPYATLVTYKLSDFVLNKLMRTER